MRKRNLWFACVMIVMLMATSGCYGLRKKFIRKKKKQDEEKVYINLKEYTSVPTEKVYRDYYVFARGWLDDLKTSLQDRLPWKRCKKAIDELLLNVTQMTSLLNEHGRLATQEIVDECMALREFVYSASSLSDATRWIDRIDRLKRKLEKTLSYENVSPWFVSSETSAHNQ